MSAALQRRRATIALLSGICLSFLSVPAFARRGRVRLSGRGLASGSRNYAGPTLSRDQLRNCVGLQNRINAAADRLDKEEDALAGEKAKLEALDDLVERRQRVVDRYDEDSVNSYNSLVQRHRRLVQQYNGKLPAFNARVNEHNANVASFNSNCANQAYYESDMKAVLAETAAVK